MGCLKADLDSTIFAYDYRARLTYVKTLAHRLSLNFSLTTSTMCRTNVVGLIYTTRSVVKSWRILDAHDSRKQKSYRLNRP